MADATSGPTSPETIRHARALLEAADGVLVLTGAGISAESGVPTFRGAGGLWKDHRPEELATPGAFRRDPRLVWEWYGWRRELVAACTPNAGHRALAGWLARRPDARLCTQNVDGLHGLAALEALADPADSSPAVAPAPILELHGSLFRVRCPECGEETPHREPIDARTRDTLPRCGSCGGILRPAVVWFGEMLPHAVLEEAFAAATRASVALVIGTSALVHPAASLPLVTLEAGGGVIEVNPEPSPLSATAAVSLRGPAGTILPCLLDEGGTR